MDMINLLTSRRSIIRQKVGWLEDIEDTSWGLNGISKIDVPSVNESPSWLQSFATIKRLRRRHYNTTSVIFHSLA
jgi:hypothetical protein